MSRLSVSPPFLGKGRSHPHQPVLCEWIFRKFHICMYVGWKGSQPAKSFGSPSSHLSIYPWNQPPAALSLSHGIFFLFFLVVTASSTEFVYVCVLCNVQVYMYKYEYLFSLDGEILPHYRQLRVASTSIVVLHIVRRISGYPIVKTLLARVVPLTSFLYKI